MREHTGMHRVSAHYQSSSTIKTCSDPNKGQPPQGTTYLSSNLLITSAWALLWSAKYLQIKFYILLSIDYHKFK